VQRRTAPKKLQAACRRIKQWIQPNRHARVRDFFDGLNRRLLGNYRYYGVRGNSLSLHRFFEWAKACAFKWLNRRGGRRGSLSWTRFVHLLNLVHIAQPASPRDAVLGWWLERDALQRGSEYGRGTGCGNTARPGLCRGCP
jgi:hypothetical protein